jgi:hypothetical protein
VRWLGTARESLSYRWPVTFLYALGREVVGDCTGIAELQVARHVSIRPCCPALKMPMSEAL